MALLTSGQGKPKRDMKVLSLGLPRTGTASIASALTTLGYKDVYHGIKTVEADANGDWAIMDRACDASFPNLPSYTGEPFTRSDWDTLFGHCEAVTDVAAMYAPQLIEAYPEAKVIMAVRDFDAWFRSIDEGVLRSLWSPAAEVSISVIEPMIGTVAGVAARKQILGMFKARTVQEARKNAREAYDAHHRAIREMVPEGMLLEYRMGQGWEPICEFLDKPVPDGEFPWVNEAAELRKVVADKIKRNVKAAAVRWLPWVGAAVAVGFGVWGMARTG